MRVQSFLRINQVLFRFAAFTTVVGGTHTRALRTRCELIRDVRSSGNWRQFSDGLCYSRSESEATPETYKLEFVYQPRLRLGPLLDRQGIA